MGLMRRFWVDDYGYINSTEMLLVFVISVLGVVSGLTALRNFPIPQ
jgi:hypothetical protein